MIRVKPECINIITNLDCAHFQIIIFSKIINKKLYYKLYYE